MPLWLAVARWLELLPYCVGGVGAMLVLGGLGAHRPLLRRLTSARQAPNRKVVKATSRIREAGDVDVTRRVSDPARAAPAAQPTPAPEPEPAPRPKPPPAEPETVDEEQVESFQALQARLAAARARRAAGAEPEAVPAPGPDLQSVILEVAKARGMEQRQERQQRKAEREAQLMETQRRADFNNLFPEFDSGVDHPAPSPADFEQVGTNRGGAEEAGEPDTPRGTESRENTLRVERPEFVARSQPALAGSGEELADQIEDLCAALEAGDEAAKLELQSLVATLRVAVGALELLGHAAPYLGPDCPLDGALERAVEHALERLRGG